MSKGVTTTVIEVRAEAPQARTFLVYLTSTLDGYHAHVMERVSPELTVAGSLHYLPRDEIGADTFYRYRWRYCKELFALIKSELLGGRVKRREPGEAPPDGDAYLRANLRGWPKGYPKAVADDISGWQPNAD